MALNMFDYSVVDQSSSAVDEFSEYLEIGRYREHVDAHATDVDCIFDVLYIWLAYDTGLRYCPTYEAFLVVAIEVIHYISFTRPSDEKWSDGTPIWRGFELPIFPPETDFGERGEVKHRLLQRNYFDALKAQVQVTRQLIVDAKLDAIAAQLGIQPNGR